MQTKTLRVAAYFLIAHYLLVTALVLLGKGTPDLVRVGITLGILIGSVGVLFKPRKLGWLMVVAYAWFAASPLLSGTWAIWSSPELQSSAKITASIVVALIHSPLVVALILVFKPASFASFANPPAGNVATQPSEPAGVDSGRTGARRLPGVSGLMAGTPDKSGPGVKTARPTRIALGALVLLAALVFLLTAAAILSGDRSRMPSPQGALALGLFFAVLGLGFIFIGVRLMKMKEATDSLFSTRAALVGGPFIAVVGLAIGMLAIYHGQMDAVYGGIALILMGLGVYRSGRKRKSALENSLANNAITEHPRPKPDPTGAHIDKAGAGNLAAISTSRTRGLGWAVAIVVVAVAAVLAAKAYRAVPGAQWMTSAQYQREFDARARDGFYPHQLEGECQSGAEKFRADWKAIPPGAAFLAHHGMTRQDYERRDQEYRSKDFAPGPLKQFKDCSGVDRYQATWLKR